MSCCKNCGAGLSAGAAFCVSCGTKVESGAVVEPATQPAAAPVAQPAAAPVQEPVVVEATPIDDSQNPYAYAGQASAQGNQPYAQPYEQAATPAVYEMSESDHTLRLVAFILNVVSTVAMAAFIIPLAWMIPMTVRSWGIYKGTKPNTVAFGVCTLIFVNLIGGILLLVSKKDN